MESVHVIPRVCTSNSIPETSWSSGYAAGVDGRRFWVHTSCKQISISVGQEEDQQEMNQETDPAQDIEQGQDHSLEQDQGQK